MQIPPGFRPKPSPQDISGRMLLRPTRVRVKPARFHISAPEYTKNAPDFTFPNRDTPKPRPVLHPNLRRGYLRGVCNTPLHGYVQNLAGFIFPNKDTPKTRPVLDLDLRRGSFSGRMLLRPYTGTCKIWRVSFFPTRIRQKRTRFHPFQ